VTRTRGKLSVTNPEKKGRLQLLKISRVRAGPVPGLGGGSCTDTFGMWGVRENLWLGGETRRGALSTNRGIKRNNWGGAKFGEGISTGGVAIKGSEKGENLERRSR